MSASSPSEPPAFPTAPGRLLSSWAYPERAGQLPHLARQMNRDNTEKFSCRPLASGDPSRGYWIKAAGSPMSAESESAFRGWAHYLSPWEPRRPQHHIVMSYQSYINSIHIRPLMALLPGGYFPSHVYKTVVVRLHSVVCVKKAFDQPVLPTRSTDRDPK
ncbi:hypothetical protein KUCAC02_001519, partial [Chaenocephalus aceratus]